MGVLILNLVITIYLIVVSGLGLFLLDNWLRHPSILFYVFTFPIQIFRKNGRKKLFSSFK